MKLEKSTEGVFAEHKNEVVPLTVTGGKKAVGLQDPLYQCYEHAILGATRADPMDTIGEKLSSSGEHTPTLGMYMSKYSKKNK